MYSGDRQRPLLSPQEGWLSDGRQVLHFQPCHKQRWHQSLDVTFGEVIPGGGEPPLGTPTRMEQARAINREPVTKQLRHSAARPSRLQLH